MGCNGLILRPWSIKYEKIVHELQQKQDNRWTKTLRRNPDLWIVAAWRKVYRFAIQREGMATRREKFAEGKFANPPHPKDRYPLPECKDPRARRMLEFVVSILYPKKPAGVTVTVENTIFGVHIGEREVNWALVIRDMVKRLLTGIGKLKPMPICPYLLHLYITHDVVQPEDKVYMVGESFMRHNIKLKEDELASLEDSEPESLSLREI